MPIGLMRLERDGIDVTICHGVLVDELMFVQSREVGNFIRGGADEAPSDCPMAAWSKNFTSFDATTHNLFAHPCAQPWRNAYPARQSNQIAQEGSVSVSVDVAPMRLDRATCEQVSYTAQIQELTNKDNGLATALVLQPTSDRMAILVEAHLAKAEVVTAELPGLSINARDHSDRYLPNYLHMYVSM